MKPVVHVRDFAHVPIFHLAVLALLAVFRTRAVFIFLETLCDRAEEVVRSYRNDNVATTAGGRGSGDRCRPSDAVLVVVRRSIRDRATSARKHREKGQSAAGGRRRRTFATSARFAPHFFFTFSRADVCVKRAPKFADGGPRKEKRC